jgi:hypothetical protein
MGVNARLLAVGTAVLVLGLVFLFPSRPGLRADDTPDEKDVKAAQEIVTKAAGGNAAAMKKAADELVDKKLVLKAAMYVFKLRMADGTGGAGVGAKPGAITPDGIEAKLINLSKKAPAATAAKKEGPDLEKAAQIALAMSYVAEAYAPKKKVGDKDPKDWKMYTDEMRSSAEEFAKAAKKADPKGIQDAAKNLTAACNACHGVFRD